MSSQYSESRPLHGSAAQTPLYEKMRDYAHSNKVQELLQKMTADLFIERPADPVAWMIKWLSEEQKRSGTA
ncbi:hypothetical protein HXX76_012105 [Chlamydomonas incerta]|uniref:Uncharacterized protein n=1 Tax=Chlamydomonas incerta TaxID=51695 RepID=A0A835VU05_CHLIN|nr:hypothetical protein HXX76_012105 [Chlamydomonas incerta]|eukprot:KAG2427780.1 hypothetical protein HXX76_012105 [Chlamydomonas incerta]